MIRLGDSGEHVQQIQQILINLGYHLGRQGADGIFGKATQDAVIEWQKKTFVDGIIGDDDYALLVTNKPRKGIEIPENQKELIQLYGRPWDDPTTWTGKWLGWANIGLQFQHVTNIKPRTINGVYSCFIKCNVDCILDIESIFKEITLLGLNLEIKTYDGCQNVRMIRGHEGFTDQALNITGIDNLPWSTHTWGVAVDFNAFENKLGKKPNMHPSIVRIFKEHNWVWGGDFKRLDGMHFQRCKV